MSKTTRPPEYFEALYAENPDPWDFESSRYEAEKYAATIAMLGGRRFAHGLEIGCSIGVLTARLAAHCDRLLAVDVVDSALARAKTRCAGLGHVKFEKWQVPRDWVPETFDLIVLSEVLYFLSPADIGKLAALVGGSLAADGIALLVNFTEAIDEPCSGHDAAEIFIKAGGFTRVGGMMRERYRIDVVK